MRRHVRAPRVIDLLAGHGLTGALFAVFEPSVEEVVLFDRRRPDSFDDLMGAVAEIAPWGVGKLRYVRGELRTAKVAPGTGLVAVHACGSRTDLCLDLAVRGQAHVAVMPCCYVEPREAPECLVQSLGNALASDVDRTYRMRAAGYRVRWSAVPTEITPMNRILIATRTT